MADRSLATSCIGSAYLKAIIDGRMRFEPATAVKGVRVLDFSALGPGPFASMILADFGAEVLGVCRPELAAFDPGRGIARGKDLFRLDLSRPRGRALAARLAGDVDIVLEGFRPGVMERLELGPDNLMSFNPRLIYARLTGWGQQGPYAPRAGHDINYLAISGVLGMCGPDAPVAPPAFLGDLANGSYLAVIGILMALMERERSGRGRVVDAAIVDGATYMLTAMFAERRLGSWSGEASEHLLTGSAPFYRTYLCSDGGWFAVGAIESKFYRAFLKILGLDDVPSDPVAQFDRATWPHLEKRVAKCFLQQSRDEWANAFSGNDACGTPVLRLNELPQDPHLAFRRSINPMGDAAAAAPRLDGQLSTEALLADSRGRDATTILADYGLSLEEIGTLLKDGTIADHYSGASS